MGSVTKYFDWEDFNCHCHRCTGSGPYIKMEAIYALESVRITYGKPILVTRGISCTAHNEEIGGSADSRHLPDHADAVDLASRDSEEAYGLVAALIRTGLFTFIEVCPKHVHADMRPGPFRLITGVDK